MGAIERIGLLCASFAGMMAYAAIRDVAGHGMAEERMADDVRKVVAAPTHSPETTTPMTPSLTLQDVSNDRFVLIHIEGMHCHRCEQAIRKAMSRYAGVHEVEVDFASGLASVLYDVGLVSPASLVDAVREAGYKPNGYTLSHSD
jgi:copper chaperone CopZ